MQDEPHFSAPSIQRCNELVSSLSILLDEEFDLLTEKNLESVENVQATKFSLMQDILKIRENIDSEQLSKATLPIFEKLQATLTECRDKHLRNDLLLKKQIEITKSLLNVITRRNEDQASVYDKLGRLR